MANSGVETRLAARASSRSTRVTAGSAVVMIRIRPSPAAIQSPFGAQNAGPNW